MADSTQRFSDRTDAYVAARPHYPAALATLLARELGLAADAQVADIGSGTGISCEPFLAAGFTVLGVEPNDAMRAAAEREFAREPSFRSVNGAAEATTLAPASVDLATAGQAFHWFDHARFRAELLRILKPAGALALFWNSRRHDASDFMRGYNDVLMQYSAEYRAKWKGDDVGAKHAPAMEIVFGGRHWREAELDNSQTLDREGLIARADSGSYAPKPGDPQRAAMVEALHALFDRCAQNDCLQMVYRTRIFFGQPR